MKYLSINKIKVMHILGSYIKSQRVLWLMLLIGMMAAPATVSATHVVGGELSYRCLGTNLIEFTLVMRRDCALGDPEAFHDNPAFISVYDMNNNLVLAPTGNEIRQGFFNIDFMGADTVMELLNTDCELFADPVCVTEAVYRKVIVLPEEPITGGYQFVYQRCCRNSSLSNIVDPLFTGMSLVQEITNEEISSCNRAPDLPSFPPIYACIGQPFTVDQSGTDPDGDELQYRLTTPFVGATDAEPYPTVASAPPYDLVTWSTGHAQNDMLMTAPGLTIDINTGVLTVIPEIQGQYLVALCVDEIDPVTSRVANSTCREFEVNVRPCEGPPEVMITAPDFPDTLCDVYALDVDGVSNAEETFWVINGVDTVFVPSDDPSAELQFDSAGVYTVTLVGSNDGCTAAEAGTLVIIESGFGDLGDLTIETIECMDGMLAVEVIDTNLRNVDTDGATITYTINDNGNVLFETMMDSFQFVFTSSSTVEICRNIETVDGCGDQQACVSFDVDLLDLEYDDMLALCIDRPEIFSFTGQGADSAVITWQDDNGLIINQENDGRVITLLATDTVLGDTIFFEATNPAMCSQSGFIVVTATDRVPQISFEVEPISCDTLGIIITNTSQDSVEVLWDFDDNTTSSDWRPSHTYNQPGSYTITMTGRSANGVCDTTISMEINVPELSTTITVINTETGGTDFCDPAEGLLIAQTSGATGTLTYQWSPDYNVVGSTMDDTLRVNVDSSLTYCVTVTEEDSGCIDSACVPVFVGVDLSLVLVSPDGVICAGDTVKVAAVTDDDGELDCNYNWTFSGQVIGADDQDTLCFIIGGSQTVDVTVGCDNGCVESASLLIEVRDLNSIIQATVDPEEMMADNEILQLNVENGDPSWTYSWEGPGLLPPTDIIDPTAQPGEIGVYTYDVSVVDNFGCEAMSSASTREPEDNPCEFPYVFVPNAFSPNGDNMNDVLVVQGRDIDEIISFVIYNRWGQEVYRVDNATSASWDGDFEGEPGHTAVYGYYLHVRCFEGDESIQQGNISLLR